MRGSSHAIVCMHTNVCMSFNVFVRVNISILRHPCASAGRIGLWSPRESLPSRMLRQHMPLWMLTRHRHRCLDRGCACRCVGGGLWWCGPACWAPGGSGGEAGGWRPYVNEMRTFRLADHRLTSLAVFWHGRNGLACARSLSVSSTHLSQTQLSLSRQDVCTSFPLFVQSPI